jgi:hypothetical protein
MKASTEFEEKIADLPFADSIRKGLADLEAGRETVESLLILIGEPRLRSLDVPFIARGDINADRRLYALLGETWNDEAHSQYNSLLRQLGSFARALEGRTS